MTTKPQPKLLTVYPNNTYTRSQTEMLKKVMAMLASKYLSVKAKIRAIETRLIIHALLLRDKRMVRHLLQRRTYLNQPNTDENDEDYHRSNDIAAAFLIQNPTATATITENNMGLEEDDEYPNIGHSSVGENQMEDHSASVTEMVKNDKGQDFTLENDIDRVADLFIQRFHQQIRLQKLQPESPLL